MKSKSILTRGVLPSLHIKQVGPIAFLIVADYGENIRVYHFSRQGVLVSGDNVEVDPKLLKQLQKTTTLVFQLPKKEAITHPKDETAQLQELFFQHLSRINQLLGTNITFPYTIIINPQKKLVMTRRDFGCEIKGYRFEMPSNVLTENMGDIISVQASFYQYLATMISLTDQEVKPALYNLAIILSHFYFNIRFEKVYLTALKDEFVYISGIDRYDFTKDIKSILSLKHDLKLLTPSALTHQTIQKEFRNIHHILSVLFKYQIALKPDDLLRLINELSQSIRDIVSGKRLKVYLLASKDVSNYLYRIFKESTLQSFFQMPDEWISKEKLDDLMEEIARIITHFSQTKQIGKLRELISDYILIPLMNRVLICETNSNFDPNKKSWELRLILRNEFNLYVQNVSFALSWHPKSRITPQLLPDLPTLEKFDREIELNMKFNALTMGRCTLFITISFQNPFFPEHVFSIRKEIQEHFIESLL